MLLTDLPTELLSLCLSYLAGEDLGRVSQTCKLLNEIADIGHLWQKRCLQEYGLDSLEGWPGTYRDVYSKVLHKYGCLLGLFQRVDWLYGGLIHIWYHPNGGSIVASEYYGSVVLNEPLRSKPLFHVSLSENLTVNTEWLSRHAGAVQCNITKIGSVRDVKGSLGVQWNEEEDTFEQDEEKLREEEMMKGMEYMFIQNKIRMLHQSYWYSLELERIHLPEPCRMDIPVPSTGLYKAMYSCHGVEILSLSIDKEQMKIFVTKISGDLNVPAGKVSVEADLKKPVHDNEQEDNIRQPFSVPSGYHADVDIQTIPKYCLARYDSRGTIAQTGFQYPSQSRNVLVVFDDSLFGVVWLDLHCFSLYSRATEQFQTL